MGLWSGLGLRVRLQAGSVLVGVGATHAHKWLARMRTPALMRCGWRCGCAGVAGAAEEACRCGGERAEAQAGAAVAQEQEQEPAHRTATRRPAEIAKAAANTALWRGMPLVEAACGQIALTWSPNVWDGHLASAVFTSNTIMVPRSLARKAADDEDP